MKFWLKRLLAGGVALPALVGLILAGTGAPAQAANATITGHARYCSANQLYLAVRNDAAAATHQTRIVHNGVTTYRTFSLAAGATSASYTAGVTGAYTAYVYRWNGSAYAFVTSTSGTLTCAVTASLERSGLYGRVTLRNTGTAVATVYTRRLAPSAVVTHTNGLAAGATATTPWMYFGAAGTNYAVSEELANSNTNVSPSYFTGVS